MVICTSDSGRKLYEIEEYPDYEYIAGYYAWDGVIYKKDETDIIIFQLKISEILLMQCSADILYHRSE